MTRVIPLLMAFGGLLAACGSDAASDAVATEATTAEAPASEAPTSEPDATATSEAPSTVPSTVASTVPSTVAETTTTEPPPLRILVTNDDGVAAEGIDTLVNALLAIPDVELEVTVVAPAAEQSGQGGNTTPGALTATEATTASGYPATAVAGFPADSVVWALDQGGVDVVPDLVVSGINAGQNLGPVIDASGTVGAARAAATRNVPAIAVSAGFGDPMVFDAAAAALVTYLVAHLDVLSAHEPGAPVAEVVTINTPTCAVGEVRGAAEVPLATDLQGFDYGAPVDCTSTVEGPADDVQAFFNGFTAISPTPLLPAPTG